MEKYKLKEIRKINYKKSKKRKVICKSKSVKMK